MQLLTITAAIILFNITILSVKMRRVKHGRVFKQQLSTSGTAFL